MLASYHKFLSILILLVFIGNIEIGIDLINKIINYKNLEKFNISFCFNSKDVYDYFKDKIISNFTYFSIYLSREYGTDIQPTLFMYHNISKKHNFKYIIKLHTKSIQDQYNDLTNFLLSNKISNFKKYLNTNFCNCVSNKKYYLSLNNDIFNKKILKKYEKFVDINKVFVKGTMFFTYHETFIKVINFIIKNNYNCFIFNNLYENNSINHDFSPTHYLERLFGIIN